MEPRSTRPNVSAGAWGPFDLSGKAAIVTGGARNVGRGIARCLLDAGADVLIADIDAEASEVTVRELTGRRGRVANIEVDVAESCAGDEVASRCVDTFGSVDILVNNAAIFPIALFTELKGQELDRVLAINVRGLILTAQGVAKRMIEQQTGGVIVNVGTMDAFHPAFAGLSAYGASKGAVVQVTRNMALELAPYNIRVHHLAPGPCLPEGPPRVITERDLVRSAAGALPLRPPVENRVPLGRRGTPDEVGNVAVFLASSAAAWMTGDTVLVDGGYLLS